MAFFCKLNRVQMMLALASGVVLLTAMQPAWAGTFEGSIKITDSLGDLVISQQVKNYPLGQPMLPRDFSFNGTLDPDIYTITFALAVAGLASDDPNDDTTFTRHDLEFQSVRGNFDLILSDTPNVTFASHNIRASTNGIRGNTSGSNVANVNGNVLERNESSASGFADVANGFVLSDLHQAGSARATINTRATNIGFSGSASARSVARNGSGLMSGATGGSNSSIASTNSLWGFTITEPTSYTLTSHFDGQDIGGGVNQASAVLPNAYSPANNTFSFFNAISGVWFDPPLASEIVYEMTDGSLFTKILAFPDGIDANGMFSVNADGVDLGQFAVGDMVDFGAGVTKFTVSGIDPAVDAEDPNAFPIKLEFNTTTANFDMTLLIPEPAAGMLMLTGMFALATRRRNRV